MHNLKAAVEAALPIVSVYTDDLVNALSVITEIVGEEPVLAQGFDIKKIVTKKTLLYIVSPDAKEASLAYAYGQLVNDGRTLIIINPRQQFDIIFDAGSLPVPEKLMRAQLSVVVEKEETLQKMLLLLGGCSLKEAAELIRMTMVKTKALTPQGLAHTRRELFKGTSALLPVDTEQPFYLPHADLKKWVELEKDYFLQAQDTRLRPRGLLMDGRPGVGKSSGAKWIAEQFGVPLYLLSVGGAQDKWVGNSEKNFMASLQKVEREAPCVVLLDEVEKVFTNKQDQGITSTILSMLLWWLQEHKSRVLTVMTTNNREGIPPELFRPGRIDRVMEVPEADEPACKALIKATAKSFGVADAEKELWGMFQSAHGMSQKKDFTYAQAYVVEFVKAALKTSKIGL